MLLRGESGTGKELFARAIHALSPRSDRPFITINSASIPDNLLENELFGHEKGSYTGAHMRQLGKLELAQGGTFFFDEIGDFPLHLQGKILRVLEEKTITRLGSGKDIALDIRFIFATNQDLEKAAAEKRFRQDLYFRITSFPIELPPLRERSDDILLLGDHFVRKISLEISKREFSLSAAGPREAAGLQLAGQRPRTAEHHRTGGDHRRRPGHPAPRRSSCPSKRLPRPGQSQPQRQSEGGRPPGRRNWPKS